MSAMKPWMVKYLLNVRFLLIMFAIEALVNKVHHYPKFILYALTFSLVGGLVFLLFDKWFDGFWYHLKYGKKKPKE